MKINRIIIALFFCVTVIFSVCSIKLKVELTLTQNELYENKNVLEQIADELDVVKEELLAETNRANELNESLNDTRLMLEESNEIIKALKDEKYNIGYTVTNAEINMIAKTVWGEARGCSKLQQSGVVWCILNRVDNGYWGDTVAEVVTAPSQFHGYDKNFPVDDDIKALVKDVVARWQLEKLGCGNVGRTLPSRFLYFASNGNGTNTFRTSAGSGEKWDWSWGNPYS